MCLYPVAVYYSVQCSELSCTDGCSIIGQCTKCWPRRWNVSTMSYFPRWKHVAKRRIGRCTVVNCELNPINRSKTISICPSPLITQYFLSSALSLQSVSTSLSISLTKVFGRIVLANKAAAMLAAECESPDLTLGFTNQRGFCWLYYLRPFFSYLNSIRRLFAAVQGLINGAVCKGLPSQWWASAVDVKFAATLLRWYNCKDRGPILLFSRRVKAHIWQTVNRPKLPDTKLKAFSILGHRLPQCHQPPWGISF